MKPFRTLGAVWLIASLGVADPAAAQTEAPAQDPAPEETPTMSRAQGTFDVELTPLETAAGVPEAPIDRMSIDKQFHGDLEGVSRGEMLAHRTSTQGSAGYVAIERVSGTLKGRRGSFVLQHFGILNRGAAGQTISVVPDSGTDELIGLTGEMRIQLDGGQHSYEFDFQLADSP